MKLGNKKYLLIGSLALMGVTILNGLLNINYGLLTDLALDANIEGMGSIGIKVAMIASLLMVFVYIGNRLEEKYFKNTMMGLRQNYMDVLLKRHRLNQQPSVYTSHLSNDADRIEQQYYTSLLMLLKLVLQIVVSVYILSTYSMAFVVVVIILAIIFSLAARKTSEPIQKEQKAKSTELEKYTRFIEESMDGFSVIKSHRLEKERELQFGGLISGLQKQQYKLEWKSSLIDASNGVLQGLIIALLVVFGLYWGTTMGLSHGGSIVIMLVFSDVLWPLQRVTPLITEMNGMKIVFDEYKKALDDEDIEGTEDITSFESIDFKMAGLGYDSVLLKDVNLRINKGDKVLVVGPSGAGKSTVLKTLQRDIDVLEGDVLMNGKSLNEYDLSSYYQLISIVDQIGFMFSGTVQENITMLQNIDVTKTLNDISLGYLKPQNYLMNNGNNISGGERARLLLARAHFFNKELIICDEILSSLDSSVAKDIERDVIENANTLINVSHIVFVENIDCYDKYVIVDNGKVLVTSDSSLVLERMLNSDVEFK